MNYQLKPKQERAAILLAQGLKNVEIAKEIKVTPETICNWKKDPNFEAFLNQVRWEFLETTREGLRSLSPDAVDVLKDILNNSESDAVRLKACIEILKFHGFSQRAEYWGWAIGAKDVEGVVKEREEKAYSNALMDSLSSLKMKL